jgi:hypothetical protein
MQIAGKGVDFSADRMAGQTNYVPSPLNFRIREKIDGQSFNTHDQRQGNNVSKG